MNRREEIARDFLGDAGWAGARQELLAADASFRQYFRISLNDRAAVLMDAPPPHEDIRPFSNIGKYLLQLGFSAPRILAEDTRHGFMLLEDLGDATYTKRLAAGDDEERLYGLAVDTLIRLHEVSSPANAPNDVADYDAAALMKEAMLLLEWYAPAVLRIPLHADACAAYTKAFSSALGDTASRRQTLVLRDYHVDNLMWLPERPGTARCGLLDFQDALIGARAYDLMSLLEDARRNIDPALRTRMVARYKAAYDAKLTEYLELDMAVLGAVRHAKVIGIFTRLAHRDGKPQYLGHIPRVWKLLERSLLHPDLAPLAAWFETYLPANTRKQPAPLAGPET